MSQQNNQNEPNKTPSNGMLHKMKVSLFVNRLTNWYFSKNALPYWCILALDSLAILFAGIVATYIAEGGDALANHFWGYFFTFVCTLPLFMVGMGIFHTYSGIMRYSSFVDLIRISAALVLGYLLNCLLLWILPGDYLYKISLEGIIVMLFISMCEMWTMRILVKYMYDSTFAVDIRTPVFILGVRQGGIALAKSMRNNHPSQYVVKGFTTIEEDVVGRYLLGCEVYPYDEKLISIMHSMNVKTLFISPLVTDQFLEMQDMIDKLTAAGIKIMMMPKAQWWDGKSNIRHQMVKQIAVYHPARLVLVDAAETPMHDVRLFMSKNYADIPCQTIVTSITNATRMEHIFSAYHPDYVFHAAAYKHVPMMEDNPSEAVQNNIYGTRVIADMAVKYGTKKFVMISTDKAVNPTNVMGCSKRICEIYCQSLNKAIVDGKVKGVTQFVTTRFGNVLGSNGSVIPIFKKQIAMGGPITVTHPDIIRFFMLIPEACKLVLEAGTMGKGGEIFVFDMGKPVRIADLAKRMIALSGVDGIDIKYVGLRDGEKLYEEVLNDKEATVPTHHPKIMVAKVREYPYELACQNEQELYDLSFTYDDMAVVKKMKQIVPEYKSQHSKYAQLDA